MSVDQLSSRDNKIPSVEGEALQNGERGGNPC